MEFSSLLRLSDGRHQPGHRLSGQLFFRKGNGHFMGLGITGQPIAVSYTHLDVYKRQAAPHRYRFSLSSLKKYHKNSGAATAAPSYTFLMFYILVLQTPKTTFPKSMFTRWRSYPPCYHSLSSSSTSPAADCPSVWKHRNPTLLPHLLR